jgi:hypothetical protein
MMDDILARISEFFVGGSSSPVAPRPYVRDPQREKRSELMRRLMEALSDDFNDVSPVAITATVDFAVFNVTATTDRLSRITDFAEGLDRKQTIWMEGATTSLEDIHHADSPHPFGILRGEDEQ